jgi:hypothetical protein
LAARLSGYKVDIRSDNEGVETEAVVEGAPSGEEVPAAEDGVAEEAAAEAAVAEEASPVEEATEASVEAVASDDEDAVPTAGGDDESE